MADDQNETAARRQTQAEYEAEFREAVNKEKRVFKHCMQILLGSGASAKEVVEIYRQVETPFLSQECLLPADAPADLKEQVGYL